MGVMDEVLIQANEEGKNNATIVTRTTTRVICAAIHAEKEETVTGPFTPEIEKTDDNYIRIIRISLEKDRNLSQNKEKVRKVMENFHKNYREHLTIDVDPL